MCGPMFNNEVKLTIEVLKDTFFECISGDTFMTKVLPKGTVIDVVEDEYGLNFNEGGISWCRLSADSDYNHMCDILESSEEEQEVYKEEIRAFKKFYDIDFDRSEYSIDDEDAKAKEFDEIMYELSSWYNVV